PPLYYWIAAQFFRLSANEQTARLPSAIAAIVFLLVWFRFTRRRYGQTAAMLATIFLASTLGWIGFARAAAMDMLFTVTLDLALLLLLLWFWERRPAHLYGFYALLGLATLAKGPLAVGLAGLVAIAHVATFHDWTALRKLVLSSAAAAFCAVAAPWYILCYAYNGAPFVEEFLVQQNLARLVSAAQLGHGQPFWFYVPILFAGLFPWSPLLLLPLLETLRARSSLFQDQRRAFLVWWIALPFLFFSLAENKLPGYVLPILPPLTLWIAILVEEVSLSVETGMNARSTRLPPKLPLALIGVSALLLLTVPLFAPLLSESLATGLRRALADWSLTGAWTEMLRGAVPISRWILLAGAVGFSFAFLWQKQALGAAYMALTGAAVCMLAITTHLAPSINRVASTRPVAERILSLAVPADEVAVYRIHRNQTYQLSFYLGSGLQEWSPENSAGKASLVVAGQGEQVPFAQPLSFFPGQRLRLWELTGVRIETEGR
ncbi:MAG: glycosyltransferase family 39 protein, partial [Terriglobia bacterium]